MSGQMSQPSRKGETSNTCIVVLFSKHLMKHFHQLILLQIKADDFKLSEATLKTNWDNSIVNPAIDCSCLTQFKQTKSTSHHKRLHTTIYRQNQLRILRV